MGATRLTPIERAPDRAVEAEALGPTISSRLLLKTAITPGKAVPGSYSPVPCSQAPIRLAPYQVLWPGAYPGDRLIASPCAGDGFPGISRVGTPKTLGSHPLADGQPRCRKVAGPRGSFTLPGWSHGGPDGDAMEVPAVMSEHKVPAGL